MTTGDLLSVRDLKVTFDLESGPLQAVRGVSMRVPHGGTVALVGESGSGKSVIAQAILGILPRIGRIESGQILFDPRATGKRSISPPWIATDRRYASCAAAPSPSSSRSR
jgi:peptide/nickel transport system ATP-binding protein